MKITQAIDDLFDQLQGREGFRGVSERVENGKFSLVLMITEEYAGPLPSTYRGFPVEHEYGKPFVAE